MVNYSAGKIYQIVNSINDKIYVGSTVQALSNRIHSHRISSSKTNQIYENTMYLDMRTHGTDKFRIIHIEDYPCTSKRELERREYEVMQTFDQAKLYNIQRTVATAESTKKRMSTSNKEAYKRRMKESEGPTEEQRQRISEEFKRFYEQLEKDEPPTDLL